MHGKTYAIDVAEARFPGTAKYFDSPMWAVLKGTRPTVKQTGDMMRLLDPEVQEIVVAIRPPGVNYCLADFSALAAVRLAYLGGFDALTAGVLLLALSETITSPTLRDHAMIGAGGNFLSAVPELKPFADGGVEVFINGEKMPQ